ncbi:anti-sigma-F factor Fin [Paenibacillus yanchengensis]|uniref:Anti-sigma-F factor Fin n=1 Tax=Paenibacillus yanchengensis TaxID=2035833 RepID=A0ABW4YIR2_9BACL
MAVNYVCKHCQMTLGSIFQTDLTEEQLGFHFLTAEERSDIIAYNSNGDMIVKLVCHYCAEAIDANPDLLLVENPLQ